MISRYALLFILFMSLLAGCQRYQVTLNERPVYQPPELLDAYTVADRALGDCIAQTIADQQVTRVEELTSLTCSHAGIQDLGGIEQFSRLALVNLSDNRLRDIAPLLYLPNLDVVDLSGNPDLSCGQVESLGKDVSGRVIGPEHCRTSHGK